MTTYVKGKEVYNAALGVWNSKGAASGPNPYVDVVFIYLRTKTEIITASLLSYKLIRQRRVRLYIA
jgi:hypothetical protein